MKFPNFHVSITVVTQLIGTVLQIFSALSPMVPANDKVTVAAIIAALQAVQAVLAHQLVSRRQSSINSTQSLIQHDTSSSLDTTDGNINRSITVPRHYFPLTSVVPVLASSSPSRAW